MKIRLNTLTLQCKQSRELIDLSKDISFFHGKIGSGKSSTARLIDFCFGGSLEKTPAITQELLSVSLLANFGINEVLFERNVIDDDNIVVSWKNEDEVFTLNAPLKSKNQPIWENDIENFSDLIFYLLGYEPFKVRRSKIQDESPLVRLSFRDIMWYCYLDQAHLDSSFFKLEDPIKSNKSKDVLRFVLGYYSEKLNEFELKLNNIREERKIKTSALHELKLLLKKLDFRNEEEIDKILLNLKEQLESALLEKKELEKGYSKDTHLVDDLRQKLRRYYTIIGEKEIINEELENKINEQESLRAELLSTKFKLARSQSASILLSNVIFHNCPACGIEIKNHINHENCELCGSSKDFSTQFDSQNINRIQSDIDSQIIELENSIFLHKESLKENKNILTTLKKDKNSLDLNLKNELSNYESIHLASFRENERNITKYNERIKNQENLKLLPLEISNLESEIDKLTVNEQSLKRKISEEKEKLNKSNDFIEELENIFLETLLAIGMPGVSNEDIVKINRNTWDVFVLPRGNDNIKWNFSNAGSLGKKTLFNVCYLLSLHILSTRNNLPLPYFIMIDTPMKNIGEDVNKDVFVKFYNYLYTIASNELVDTQFVIIDKEFIKPKVDSINFYERYFTPDEEEYPPLISYYRGP